jgi:hypothetical protein
MPINSESDSELPNYLAPFWPGAFDVHVVTGTSPTNSPALPLLAATNRPQWFTGRANTLTALLRCYRRVLSTGSRDCGCFRARAFVLKGSVSCADPRSPAHQRLGIVTFPLHDDGYAGSTDKKRFVLQVKTALLTQPVCSWKMVPGIADCRCFRCSSNASRRNGASPALWQSARVGPRRLTGKGTPTPHRAFWVLTHLCPS